MCWFFGASLKGARHDCVSLATSRRNSSCTSKYTNTFNFAYIASMISPLVVSSNALLSACILTGKERHAQFPCFVFVDALL